jgi:membrane protease subunit HflK
MADEPGDLPSDERVRRSVGRTFANATAIVLSLVILAAWSYFGFYSLRPGEAGVILAFGRYVRTEADPGLRWHLPPPIESHEVVHVGSIDREAFGVPAGGTARDLEGDALAEAAMQTSDNNIVNVGFVVQYRIKDAFQSRYRVEDPRSILRDAAQAAVREVVGRESIDGVLSEKRGEVAAEAQDILQQTLDRYETGIAVLGIELQEVQPPAAVRAAFDEVIAAAQDRSRAVNEAQGYANEVLPRARAEAAEQRASAEGHRDSMIALATGEADRFAKLATEYKKAPDVTRKRLYLETMEAVLPNVETVIAEPGGAVPWLPIGRGAAPPPVSAPAAGGQR